MAPGRVDCLLHDFEDEMRSGVDAMNGGERIRKKRFSVG